MNKYELGVDASLEDFAHYTVTSRLRSFRHGMYVGIVLGFVFGLFCGEAQAEVRVYKLDLSYARIMHNSDPMVPDIQHKDWSDAVNLDTGVQASRFYLDANPHFESAFGKVTTVGLLFHTGFELASWLDVEWTHHSRHAADRTNSTYDAASKPSTVPTGYPLYDSFGLVIHFVPGGRK